MDAASWWSPSNTRRGQVTAEQGRATSTEQRDGQQGLVRAGRVVEADRDSGAAKESGWQLRTGERGLGGSDGFEAAFPETPHGGRVLDNRCRSANLAGWKRAFVKRRMKRSLFGWAFKFLRQKSSKKRNQTRPKSSLETWILVRAKSSMATWILVKGHSVCNYNSWVVMQVLVERTITFNFL
jgi:hypothetical protein